ncbi:MAG: PDZ domain-containing protein [Gammaproteobacteria bacterium]|nr:PDZ domain-containing protein [Gammaproteobacteria bacterium]MBU1414848.1 PDZ domain-containing protein [Gammaproteobacteria bacterium]
MARHTRLQAASLLCLGLLAGCGGGGSDSSSAYGTPGQFAQQCAPDNPYVADADSATTSASLTTEKQWIRAYMDYAYLWYNEVPTIDASAAWYSGSMTDLDSSGVPLPLSYYFYDLLTPATTASGKLRDAYSFVYPTRAWEEYSQSGTTAGYGIEWSRTSSYVPREWRVAIVQPGSPAANAGIQRGDTLVSVDGVDFVSSTDVDALDVGLFPTGTSTHVLVFSRSGSSDMTATMTASASVTIDPVPVASILTDGSRNIGYLHFTDHITSSEAELIAAIDDFATTGIDDLVLDLRYNGGGYLYISSQLSYMIAGPTPTAGKYFEKLAYNAKRTADNEVIPIYNYSCIYDGTRCTNEQPLPTLNLGRVFIITQGNTCSASESIINGLRGIDIEVIQIGDTTCGKPYGFNARDNCGVTYFPIEFQGENYKGFADYADGFTPVTSGTSDTNLPGCPTVDDLDHALGDPSERMLATALQRLNDGTCLPAPVSIAKPAGLALTRGAQPAAGAMSQSFLRQNRILLPKGSRR